MECCCWWEIKNNYAYWQGLLRGKLVVFVDGEGVSIDARRHEEPLDPYGSFRLDGHNLEFFPTSEEWSNAQLMDLTVDRRSVRAYGFDADYRLGEMARTILVAHRVPEIDVTLGGERKKRRIE
jgi:hypothetical protein